MTSLNTEIDETCNADGREDCKFDAKGVTNGDVTPIVLMQCSECGKAATFEVDASMGQGVFYDGWGDTADE